MLPEPILPAEPQRELDDGSLRSPLGKAAMLVVGYLLLLWTIDLINNAQHRRLNTDLGIVPRDFGRLPEIATAPFLHGSVAHLAANAMPLFGLGLVAALAGVRRFIGVTALVVVVSGLGVWLFSPSNTVTVGASGVVFGYFGYLVMRGAIDRRPVDIVVALGVAISYGYLLSGVLPGAEGISWQGHLSGVVGGVLAAWVFRRRPRPAPASALGTSTLPQVGRTSPPYSAP
ncbi:MAG TPA: rhomboid family intramembrane serine protease [Mycobacteriales bacterium]|nr:rhomboid family intramembrane serine protease [Mycobacteriales bacterium]